MRHFPLWTQLHAAEAVSYVQIKLHYTVKYPNCTATNQIANQIYNCTATNQNVQVSILGCSPKMLTLKSRNSQFHFQLNCSEGAAIELFINTKFLLMYSSNKENVQMFVLHMGATLNILSSMQ